MAYTRLSVLLAHLILCFALAKCAISVANGEPSPAKRFGLRSSEPPTRRSPDTHFMRFGRSDGDGDGGGGSGGDGIVAPKKNVKREAVDASVSPAPSLTCVPDADTDGRVVCYSPVNVSRHFLLVTDRDRDDDDDDDEDEQRQDDDDEQSDDSAAGLRAAVDDSTADEGAVDRAGSGARNRTARRSRTRESGQRRFGRSTGEDAFPRYGRRHDNFMWLGRAGVNQNESPSGELGGGANSEADSVAIWSGDKRGSQSFIRLGRERSQMARQSQSAGRRRDAWPRASTAKDESADGGPWSEGAARQRDAFARLGRHGPGDMNQLRFGRGSSDRIGARVARRHDNFMRLGRDVAGAGAGAGDRSGRLFGRAARRHDNFMRLGRSGGGGGDFDLDMFRETRRRDSFLRLGRGGPVVRAGDVSGGGGGGGGGDDDDYDDVYRIAMATAALNSRIKA